MATSSIYSLAYDKRPEVHSKDSVSSIVHQIRSVINRENRLILLLDSLVGAFVPVASFCVRHYKTSAHCGAWMFPGASRLQRPHGHFRVAYVRTRQAGA